MFVGFHESSFCGLHVLAGLGSMSKESLKEFESLVIYGEIINSGYARSDARSFTILYATSKALISADGYQNADVVAYWKAFLDEIEVNNNS